ncbi:MAG: NADH-quinone oxidoreductase subunit M, partial [Candidatus Margulisiibacteriota bacterium]
VIITAALFLLTIEKMLLGKPNEKYNVLADLDGREIFCLAVLLILVLAIGVYPGPVLDVMSKTVSALVKGV